LTNLVFMGMGEPLANFDNLMGALAIITDSDVGLGFAAKRVTVSTAGLVPKMLDFGRQSRVSLAVSLNAADNETRSRLMPINRKYPLETLLEACRNYPLPPGRRITFEYILITGVNDAQEDARRLPAAAADPLQGQPIPFNPHEARLRAALGGHHSGLPGGPAPQTLHRHHPPQQRQDISAACGSCALGFRRK
jgi:23S rRNA (adenine2503-C2)-methyltransferase